MAKYLALDKFATLFRMVRDKGGIRASIMHYLRTDDLKDGTFVGEDEFGNKYYENNRYFYGRNRWVEYNKKTFLDYDASQVSAEWFGWLHYKSDLLPYQDPSRPKYKWMGKHTENLSGTTGQYVPYSTTPVKIEAWVPKKQ